MSRRTQLLALTAIATATYLLWLGVLGRVLLPQPRVTIQTTFVRHDAQGHTITDRGSPEAVSNDGRWLVTSRLQSTTWTPVPGITLQPSRLGFQVWNTGTGNCELHIPYDYNFKQVQFAPDNTKVIVRNQHSSTVWLYELGQDVPTSSDPKQKLSEWLNKLGVGSSYDPKRKLVSEDDLPWLAELSNTKWEDAGSGQWVFKGRRWLVIPQYGSPNLPAADLFLHSLFSADKLAECRCLIKRTDGRHAGTLDGAYHCELSEDESVAACMSWDLRTQIWDLPMRRPIGTQLALAVLPTLAFTLLLWWRLVRN